MSDEWNHSSIVVGLPGDGKTTLQRELIARHLRERPSGIVIAHDPLRQFRGCAPVADARALRSVLADAAHARRPVPRAWSVGGRDGAAVFALALEIGRRVNREDAVRVPILVPCDEGNLRAGTGGKTWMSDADREFLVTRRHAGVGPVINIQELGDLVGDYYRYATDVYTFRLTRRRAEQLDELLSLERGTAEAAGVCRLPQYRYLHFRARVGAVKERL